MPLDPAGLRPNIRLFGPVNDAMLAGFLGRLDALDEEEPVIVELFSPGGDAEVGRRIALELRLLTEGGRDVVFLGKTMVYSAGVTIMSGVPRERRFLSRDCLLLIHQRGQGKDIPLHGHLRANLQTVREAMAQLEASLRLEEEGWRMLAKSSALSPEEIARRAETSWYVTAKEALDLRLITAVF